MVSALTGFEDSFFCGSFLCKAVDALSSVMVGCLRRVLSVSLTLLTLLTSSSFFLNWMVFFWFSSWAFLSACYFFRVYFLALRSSLMR